MAVGPITSSILPPVVQEWYTGQGLRVALPKLNHARFGQIPTQFPQKSGTRAMFRRMEALPVNKVPIIEMTTPSPVSITYTDVYADLDQYGAWCKYSDKVAWTTQDPQISMLSRRMGENGGESLDEVYRDILLTTTSEYLAGAVALRSSIASKAVYTDFDKINRLLDNARATYIDEQVIKATTGVGTAPVRQAFYVLVHPDVKYDIDNTTNFPGFLHPSQYSDGGASALDGEIGAYKNFRFLMSDKEAVVIDSGAAIASTGLKSTGGVYNDVYQCLIFAKDAYGIVPLSGHSYETLVTPLEASHANPMALFGTVAWKAMTTLALLNETWMLRYECGATA